jgi:hypothetical protein
VSLRSLRGFKWAVLGLLAVVCCIAWLCFVLWNL